MKRKHKLKFTHHRPKKAKRVFVAGFPPYTVVESNGDFKMHHSGLFPSFGVKVVVHGKA